jgi:hypothetical protein
MRINTSTVPFKTKADMWRHLLDGGAVTNLDDSCSCFVYLKDGNPIYDDGSEVGDNFQTDPEWRPFPVSKLIEKVVRQK